MVDVAIAPEQVRDPAEKNEPGKGRGRDPERSPIIWVNAANAGFAPPGAVPWLPLEPGWETENAAEQAKDSKSMLMLYRKLLALRRQHDTLHAGGIAEVVADRAVLRYTRVRLAGGESTDFQVVLNLGKGGGDGGLCEGDGGFDYVAGWGGECGGGDGDGGGGEGC